MFEVGTPHSKTIKNKHKLPSALLKLITETNTTNVVGFGRTKRQQLESLLHNLLKEQDDTFILLFKEELTSYYANLHIDLTRAC